MELADIIAKRRSIRAFTHDRVPRERVEEVLAAAVKAPSAINLQPWEFTVVMNEERERLSRKLIKTYGEKRISCSPGNVTPLPEAITARGRASFEGMLPYLEGMGSTSTLTSTREAAISTAPLWQSSYLSTSPFRRRDSSI